MGDKDNKGKSEDKPKAPTPKPVAEDKWDAYVVAKGRTVQCNRGEIREGKRIRPGDFDSSAFEVFKKSGAIVKG